LKRKGRQGKRVGERPTKRRRRRGGENKGGGVTERGGTPDDIDSRIEKNQGKKPTKQISVESPGSRSSYIKE